MIVTGAKTLQLDLVPNVTWLVLETDEGITGLGETSARFGKDITPRLLLEVCSRFIVGKNPLDIEKLWLYMFRASVNTTIISTIDIALWDILGKYSGLPIYRLLGGACRDKVKLYNTALTAGGYHDEEMWNNPDKLAEELISDGIDMVKFGPFDRYAGIDVSGMTYVKEHLTEHDQQNGARFLGHYIHPQDLKKAADLVGRLCETLGDRMMVTIDMHSIWDATTAVRIAHALEPHDVFWIEDPVLHDDVEALMEVKASTRLRVAVGERRRTRYEYRRILEKRAADIIIVEPLVTGGISETKKIAIMTEAYEIPFTTHDQDGPVSLLVCSHLNITIPNLFVMESRRHNYRGNSVNLMTAVPEIKDGYIKPLEGPGLGAELKPELWERRDATVHSLPKK